jgi:hypothetical protein
LLSLLAVGGDINAALDLLADDVGHRAPNSRGVRFFIVRLAVDLRFHQVQKVGGTRQASAVSGQDTSGAAMGGHVDRD